MVDDHDKNFFWPERCKIIEVVKYKDEAVTIVVRYKDEAKTIVDDTIPSADLIAWMAAGKIEKVVGGSKVVATACAKILILDDPNERPAGWDYKGEFFGAILEASQTDPRFRESVVYSSNGSYKSETSPAVPTLPYLSFYWALDSYGSRSAWSFDIVHRCSRAVVLWQNDKIQMIDHVKRVLGVVEHPLFMSACFRSAQESTQREDYEESRDKINTIERKIGYFAFLVTDPEPMDVRPDLAGLSRRAGHRLADVGRQQLLLSLSVSVRQNLCIAEKYRWAKWFPDNRTELDGEGKAYAALCEAVLRLDDDIEQYLRASQYKLIALQERAKTLLTVLFNLIARQDVNASLTIAVMTMLFLPATFFAALFATPILDWKASPVIQPRFWVYWAFTLPCTLLVWVSWYFITRQQKKLERKTIKATLKQKSQNLKKRLFRSGRDIEAQHEN